MRKLIFHAGFMILSLSYQTIVVFAQSAAAPPQRRPGLMVWGVDTVRVMVHDTVKVEGDCGCNILVGLETGIHINEWSQSIQGLPSLNNSSLLNGESASGISFRLGAFVDVPLKSLAGLGLQFRLAYNWVSAKSGGAQVGSYDLTRLSDNTTVPGNVTADYSIRTQVFDIALLLRYEFSNVFGSKNILFFGAGPRIRLRTTPFTTTQTLTVVNNATLGFPGTNAQSISNSTEHGSEGLLRPGIDAVIGFQYSLNNYLSLIFSIGGDVINFGPSINDETSLAASGGGDRSRQLSGQLSDLFYTSRRLSQYFLSVGIGFKL